MAASQKGMGQGQQQGGGAAQAGAAPGQQPPGWLRASQSQQGSLQAQGPSSTHPLPNTQTHHWVEAHHPCPSKCQGGHAAERWALQQHSSRAQWQVRRHSSLCLLSCLQAHPAQRQVQPLHPPAHQPSQRQPQAVLHLLCHLCQAGSVHSSAGHGLQLPLCLAPAVEAPLQPQQQNAHQQPTVHHSAAAQQPWQGQQGSAGSHALQGREVGGSLLWAGGGGATPLHSLCPSQPQLKGQHGLCHHHHALCQAQAGATGGVTAAAAAFPPHCLEQPLLQPGPHWPLHLGLHLLPQLQQLLPLGALLRPRPSHHAGSPLQRPSSHCTAQGL